MKQVIEGSHAVAEAVRLARVRVISAYPITPQTHIVEALSEYCADRRLDARFICVESEHSAMAAVIGAASTGVRAFTATSGQGLAYMHELLHWTAGARLPVVMAEVNRALAPGWNIWADQTDSLSQRDTGWVQLYCEDGQEVFDTTLTAFALAEAVNLPVMVVLDAFFLSHTFEPVDIPEPAEVDAFLPPLVPRIVLDPDHPCALGQMAPPGVYMEMRRSLQDAMEQVPERLDALEADFFRRFGRRYGALEAFQTEDADTVLVVSGSVAATARHTVSLLRAGGERAGMLKIKMLRPFPAEAVRRALGGARKVAVIDRNLSPGVGGIFAQEIRAALCNLARRPPVFGCVVGLGGRDITPEVLSRIYREVRDATGGPGETDRWVGLNP